MRLRFAAPAVLALAALAGCLTYFVVAPAPLSQPATLVAPPAEESPSTVGLARTDTLTVVDRLRPSDEDEDIVKAFRRATEDRQPVEVQDAALDTDEQATAGPVPLKKAPAAARPVTPGAQLVRLCSELSDTGRRGKPTGGNDWMLQHVRYAVDGGSANSA